MVFQTVQILKGCRSCLCGRPVYSEANNRVETNSSAAASCGADREVGKNYFPCVPINILSILSILQFLPAALAALHIMSISSFRVQYLHDPGIGEKTDETTWPVQLSL
ncbi:hypothetical protein KIL84_023192 [Mauremys mutica]|uniref:Uncharacterized protein n=1 Tax=Mauremys mutica TaxID=74926 RepID=A0A9D3WS70_9SAUR|nr:hypothetical protein KIL84_023192 [Mauremys mutica]